MHLYKVSPRQYLSLYNSWFLFPIQTTAAKRYAKSSHRRILMIIWLLLVFVSKKTMEFVQDLLLGLPSRDLVIALWVIGMSSGPAHIKKNKTNHHALD